MNTTLLRVAGNGLLFLIIFLSGFWLSKAGKPFNVVVFNIHKLVSVLALIFLIIIIYQVNQTVRLSTTEIIVSAITGLFFLATIVSGGLLSTNKPMSEIILIIHRVTPFVTAISTAITLYLLLGRK